MSCGEIWFFVSAESYFARILNCKIRKSVNNGHLVFIHFFLFFSYFFIFAFLCSVCFFSFLFPFSIYPFSSVHLFILLFLFCPSIGRSRRWSLAF